MKSVIFKQDYRGVLTQEQPYKKGETAVFPDDWAFNLVKAGRADYVKDKRSDVADTVPELTLQELRELAKKKGIKGYAKMKKVTLLRKLQ